MIPLQETLLCKGTETEVRGRPLSPSSSNELISSFSFSYKNVHQLSCLGLKCESIILLLTF